MQTLKHIDYYKTKVMKKYFFLTSFLLMFTLININAQTVDNTIIINPICNGSSTGSVIIDIAQTSPAIDVMVKLYWQDPYSGFWINLGITYSNFPAYVTNFSFPKTNKLK